MTRSVGAECCGGPLEFRRQLVSDSRRGADPTIYLGTSPKPERHRIFSSRVRRSMSRPDGFEIYRVDFLAAGGLRACPKITCSTLLIVSGPIHSLVHAGCTDS